MPCCIIVVTFILSFRHSHTKKNSSYVRAFQTTPHSNLHPSSPKASSAHSRMPVKPTKRAKPKSPQSAPAKPPDVARPVSARPVVSNATNVNSSLLPKTSRKMTARRAKRSRPNHARTDPRPKTRPPHQLSLATTPHQLSPAATPRTRR